MAWSEQINVQDLKVAVAPFGGMIAVIRDERRFTPVQTSGKPAILIFSAAGELRSSIKVGAMQYTFSGLVTPQLFGNPCYTCG